MPDETVQDNLQRATTSTVVIAIDEPLPANRVTPALVVLSGWEIGRQIDLETVPLLIGRAPHCDIVIPSTSVSREHARVEATDGGIFISDLGSSNGTQVNGTPVVKARLKQNDKVRMGEVVLRFIENDVEEHRYHQEVHRRIHQHGLTGLMTRDSFKDRLGALLSGTRPGVVHCLAITDLDGLKPINDVYGHEAGNSVITGMGEMIRNTLRSQDFGGVYGGDECMLCFPHTKLEEAHKTLECLRAAIEHHRFTHEEYIFRVTISCGLAAWPQHGETLETLFKAADDALYRAKRGGRNQVAVAGRAMVGP
jgi:diguanylate cyclase (GGDEF)-like protein